MKKIFIAVALTFTMSLTTLAVNAPKASSDTTVVVKVNPIMHCANCEKKIKNNVRFVKGVKSIETDRQSQTVTIKADKKTYSRAALDKAFAKIGFKIQDAN